MKKLSGILLCFWLGCASPGKEIVLLEGDFALLELELQDCTSNSEHIGFEKLLRRLYGTEPQIDLDRQIARTRVSSPTIFDFPRLAEQVWRTNTGLGGMLVTVRAVVRDREVKIVDSGQRLPLDGETVTHPAQGWRRLRLLGWKEGGPVRARIEGRFEDVSPRTRDPRLTGAAGSRPRSP